MKNKVLGVVACIVAFAISQAVAHYVLIPAIAKAQARIPPAPPPPRPIFERQMLPPIPAVVSPRNVEQKTETRSAELVYSVKVREGFNIQQLVVFCEKPNGNEVYVVVNGSGVPYVHVVPGGCK